LKAFFARLSAFLTALRVWTVNLFTLALVVYVVVIVVLVVQKMPEQVDPQDKVLIISPRGLILDQEVFTAEPSFPFNLSVDEQVQSRDLIRLIRAASDDDRLAGVLIDFSKAGFAGSSTALNIATELAALRESGKPVIAFSESMTTSSYLMAAQAHEIYVHPSGALSISGLGGYRDYTRELTDKLKISIHNYSQGEYKSAVEGFTRADMSDKAREQLVEIYQPIWSALKERMSGFRAFTPETLQDMADNHPAVLLTEAAYDNLEQAENIGLIDGTKGFPEFRAYMIERFGEDADSERETYPHIGADAYFAQLSAEESEAEEQVAVVFVQGAIRQGKQGPGVAGSEDIANLLRTAREDENTKAIVVRVNSPGGSVIASDIIRDEVVAARARGIPVVVSMGDVAASGGVWVSTPADMIFAEPQTITGSIGVAIAFPTLENVFDYAGINFDGVTTSEYAGWGLYHEVDEKLDALFARWASSAYSQFVNTVASDRDRTPDYIRSIAGGRVWMAPRALELGLVDKLGTLEDAIAEAAERAELEDYRTEYVVKKVSPVVAFLRQVAGATLGVEVSSGSGFAARIGRLLETLEDISQPRATVMCAECMLELQ
jgi:protease-4